MPVPSVEDVRRAFLEASVPVGKRDPVEAEHAATEPETAGKAGNSSGMGQKKPSPLEMRRKNNPSKDEVEEIL